MSSFSSLKTAIQNAIKANGNQEITGNLLQGILLSIVETLGDSAINALETGLSSEATTRGNKDTELQNLITGVKNNVDNGYVYAGIAIPTTTPVSGKVFYIATKAGTYTNLGGLSVTEGITILKYNGSTWSKEQVIYGDGGVFDVTAQNGGITFASLEALLGSGNLSTLIPTAVRKGGMSIKFVQTSDNKYVQFRYMGTETTGNPNPFLDTDNWQNINAYGELRGYTTSGLPIARAVVELYLQGSGIDKTHTYELRELNRAIGNYWFINIFDKNTNTRVARYIGQGSEQYGILELSQGNSSNITGYIIVDWNYVPQGYNKNLGIELTERVFNIEESPIIKTLPLIQTNAQNIRHLENPYTDSTNSIAKSIVELYLYGTGIDNTHSYTLDTMSILSGGYYQIKVKDVTSSTIVTGKTIVGRQDGVIELTQQNSSSIYGYIIVNWDLVPSGENTNLGIELNVEAFSVSCSPNINSYIGLANKVDKVEGKQLSTNDYTDTEKTLVARIPNINDWIDKEASTFNNTYPYDNFIVSCFIKNPQVSDYYIKAIGCNDATYGYAIYIGSLSNLDTNIAYKRNIENSQNVWQQVELVGKDGSTFYITVNWDKFVQGVVSTYNDFKWILSNRCYQYPQINQDVDDLIDVVYSGGITLTKNGNTLTFTEGSNSIGATIEHSSGYNGNPSFDFTRFVYNGVTISVSDECPAVHILNTTIGGFHGQPCINATIINHGLDNTAIGTEWLNGNGRKFYPMRIVDENHIIFLSENLGSAISPSFVELSIGTLTRNGTTLTISDRNGTQLWPAIKNHVCKIYNEDGKEINVNGDYTSRYFDVVESYEIVNPASVLDNMIARAGESSEPSYDGDAVLRIENMYKFIKGLTCIVCTNAVPLSGFEFTDYLFAMAKIKGAPSTTKYYIPNSKPWGDVDLRQPSVVSWGASGTPNISCTEEYTEDTTHPINRVIQYAGDLGFAIGYITDQGVGKDLFSYATSPMSIANNSGKIYPHAVQSTVKGSPLDVGDIFNGTFYRSFFIPETVGNRLSEYHYEYNGSVYVYLDYKGSMVDHVIIDSALDGKNITVIENQNSTLKTDVYNGGFYVDAAFVANKTCYMVVKIN